MRRNRGAVSIVDWGECFLVVLDSLNWHHLHMAETKPSSGKRGRQPDASSTSGKVRELLKTGMKPADIAKKLGCRPALVYNVKARMGMAKKRGPGRPPKQAGKVSAAPMGAGLDGIIAAVRSSEQQRQSLRMALEKIHALVQSALN